VLQYISPADEFLFLPYEAAQGDSAWHKFEDIGFSRDPMSASFLAGSPPNPGSSGSPSNTLHDPYYPDLEPVEHTNVTQLDLDETFWWVWMVSQAGEETAERKRVFGHSCLIEIETGDGTWFVLEE
jgi:hypothetical protein